MLLCIYPGTLRQWVSNFNKALKEIGSFINSLKYSGNYAYHQV